MRLFFVLCFVLVSCGDETRNGNIDLDPRGHEQNQDHSPGENQDIVIQEECDDPLNPISVNGECFKHCDQTGNYCLKHNEMGSQLDPTKKIPLCNQSDGNFLIDDVCARGVITIDSANDILTIGNIESDKLLYKYEKQKYIFNENVKYSFYSQLNHDYETNYPQAPETPRIYVLSTYSASFRTVISPGSLDHPKLPYILNLNGHKIDTKNISSSQVKNYCNEAVKSQFENIYDYVKIEEDIADPNNGTYYIHCTVENPIRVTDGQLTFYCHGKEDRCYPNYFNR